MEDKSHIADFYRGKSVFLTGGTGFLGKTITEKLLYSCPDIDKIYLLLREHKGFNLEKRFNTLFKDPLFHRLKTEKPESLRKVVPILGDLTSDDLITYPQDVNTLIEKVSVVFHVAATIRFNEQLKVAMLINVEGSRKVLQLSRQMKQLKAVVYVSTAFVNSVGKTLEEKLYPVSISEDIYKRLNEKNFTEQDEAEILGVYPNTYIYTKAIAETIAVEEYKDLPIVIVRPSIITAMKGDPLPGWIDNWAGATSLLYPVGKGYHRVLLCKPDNLIDIIPVDYVSNCIIIAAPKAKIQNTAIFNVCTSECNPITLKRMTSDAIDIFVENGYNEFPYPSVIYTMSFYIEYAIFTIIWILSYFGDLFLRVQNKTPRYEKTHRKVLAVHNILRYFTSRTWLMKCDATRALYQNLAPTDRKTFYCDPITINWKSYMVSYCLGIEKYLVNKTRNK